LTGDNDVVSSHSIPFAIEAAWKLGRWAAIDDLLVAANGLQDNCDVSTTYHLSLGQLMLGLQQRSQRLVDTSLASGRMSTLSALSNMSRESYSRSYPYLVRLHCLREIEDASQIFAGEAHNLSEMTNAASALDWNDRLDVVSTLKSTTIIDVRSALARLANDTALEGSLHLTKGIKARKNGMYKVAANSFAKAASTIFHTKRAKDKHSMIELADFMDSVQMQKAKLQHNVGEREAALRILGGDDDNVHGWLDMEGGGHAQKFALKRDASAMSKLLDTTCHDVANSDRFAKRLLQSTQWMVEGGLKGVSELTERFRVAHELAPKWEKGHFQYAKYVDAILETRISALAKRDKDRIDSVDDDATRSMAVLQDGNCLVYLKLAIEQYIEALKLGEKHVYLALPRLLSLWFEFTAIPFDDTKDADYKTNRKSSESKGKHDLDAVNKGHFRRSHPAPAHSLHEHYARGN
jgi:serine/threonine-protein kinase ATR